MLQFVAVLAFLNVAAATTTTEPPPRNVSFNYVSDIRDYEGSAYHITCEYDGSSKELAIHLNHDGSEALKMLRYQWRTEGSVVDDTYHFKSNASKKVTLSGVPARTRISIGLVPDPDHEQGGKYWIYIGSTCWTGSKIGKPSKPVLKPSSAFTHPLVEWTAPKNPNGPIDGYDLNWCVTQEEKPKTVQTRAVMPTKEPETLKTQNSNQRKAGNASRTEVAVGTSSDDTSSTTSTASSSTGTESAMTSTTTTPKPEPKCATKDIPVNPANVNVFQGYKTTIEGYDPAVGYRVCIRAYNYKGTDKIHSEEECQTRKDRAHFEKLYFEMCPQ
ncbi:uncharacterized protein LOC100897498 [Galendromus occidentalis]|uniref:Uncharacterized protein LOC100897498 n=1 Tax=Galendromus occidentalis TaxID=34638 RepID=A0AAJ6QXJ3_9ACAR|nr:uncharacterized protein LOC100897498 [Galendromus occidentalis]